MYVCMYMCMCDAHMSVSGLGLCMCIAFLCIRRARAEHSKSASFYVSGSVFDARPLPALRPALRSQAPPRGRPGPGIGARARDPFSNYLTTLFEAYGWLSKLWSLFGSLV